MVNGHTTTKITPAVDSKSGEKSLRQSVTGTLLEAMLYSQSERSEEEILKAAAERVKRSGSEGDKFQEVKRAAGSVFC